MSEKKSHLFSLEDELDPKVNCTLLELARTFFPSLAGLGDRFPQMVSVPYPGTSGTSGLPKEDRLEKVMARFKTLVEQIPAVTFMASYENGLSEIYVSPFIEELLGYTANEWIDNPLLWYERLHPLDRTRWNKEFASTISSAEPFNADYRFMAKDGRTVWIHGEAKVIRDASGMPSFIQGIGYDITDRKQAEEVLKRSHEDLEHLVNARTRDLVALNQTLEKQIARRKQAEEALLESQEKLLRTLELHEAAMSSMGEGLFTLDKKGRVTYINPAAVQLLGWSASEIMGRSMHNAVHYKHPDGTSFPASECPKLRVLKTGEKLVDFEDVFIRKNGSFLPVTYSSSPIISGGEITGLVVVFRDVTALKQSIQALEESRAQLAGILDSAMDTIITLDAERRIVLFNAAAEQMFGCPAIEVLGTFIDRFIPEPFQEAQRENFRSFEQTGTTRRCVGGLGALTAVRANGEEFPIEATVSQVEVAGRKLLTLIMRDVTERVQAEQKQQAALKKEEVLKREIHHRVKNNLQVIISMLYLQTAEITDSRAQEVLLECQSRTRSIALIYALLCGSENMVGIDFWQYARQLTSDLFVAYRMDPARIALAIRADSILLSVDTALPCGLIITELVSNALKHAFPDRRTGEIEIELKPVDKHQLQLRVRDNGIGVPEGFKVETARSMGMRLVADLAKQLGGNLNLESNNGTSVTITFPQL